jgi:hypothetical protein
MNSRAAIDRLVEGEDLDSRLDQAICAASKGETASWQVVASDGSVDQAVLDDLVDIGYNSNVAFKVIKQNLDDRDGRTDEEFVTVTVRGPLGLRAKLKDAGLV